VRNGAGKQNGELNRLADALERAREDGAGDEYVQGMELMAECLAVKKKAAAPKEFMLAASKAGETLGKRSNYDQRRVEIRQQAKELAAPYGGSPRLVREIIAGLTIGPLDDSAIEQLAAYCATPPPSRLARAGALQPLHGRSTPEVSATSLSLRQSFDNFRDRKAAHILSSFASNPALVLAHLDATRSPTKSLPCRFC
jgi:hypothetical protein